MLSITDPTFMTRITFINVCKKQTRTLSPARGVSPVVQHWTVIKQVNRRQTGTVRWNRGRGSQLNDEEGLNESLVLERPNLMSAFMRKIRKRTTNHCVNHFVYLLHWNIVKHTKKENYKNTELFFFYTCVTLKSFKKSKYNFNNYISFSFISNRLYSSNTCMYKKYKVWARPRFHELLKEIHQTTG